jgi:hypothetical protein
MAVAMVLAAFWDLTPSSLVEINGCFRRTCRFHFESGRVTRAIKQHSLCWQVKRFTSKWSLCGRFTYREVLTFVDRFTALPFTTIGAPLAARRIRILTMNQHAERPITFWMRGSSHFCSQNTGAVENAVPLHIDIPRIGGRSSDLPFETVLQEYLQFPYKYFLLLLPFWGYSCKRCL